LDAAKKELNAAQEMETYITTAADEAQAKLTVIKQSFETANNHQRIGGPLDPSPIPWS
jgi:hypothetical protein